MKSITREDDMFPRKYGSSSNINKPKKDLEKEEIRQNLKRLQNLVPTIQNCRSLPKIDILHHVIDYICLLEDALKKNSDDDSNVEQSVVVEGSQLSSVNSPIVAPLHRQPLKVLTPNANVAVNSCSSPDSSMVSSSRQSDKVTSSTDSKKSY